MRSFALKASRALGWKWGIKQIASEMEFPSEVNRISDRLMRSSRVTLTVGFGGLLAIMMLSGFDALRVLHQIRRDDDQIRRQFLARNHVLNDIRSELYLSGTYVRDYLLEPAPDRDSNYRTTLEQVHKEMEAALESYRSQLRPEERKDYA